MSKILRQYIDDDGLQVTEYTRDGVSVSTTIRHPLPSEPIEPVEPIEPQSTIEERLENIEATVAYNQSQTEYLVILAEFNAM